jgi:acetolactate synthase-1/2/3 large subunit
MEGDGSVLLNINALQILKDHTLPLKLCIWNNGGYYSIRNTHTAYFHRVVAADSASGVGSPDFSVLIPAWGIPYIRIRKNEDLNLLSGLFRSAGPVVCELMIDPDQKTIPKWTAGEFREN